MILLIDNYDSFTYNVYHYLSGLGAEVKVFRNDALTADEAISTQPKGIVISPGPCDPDKAGISLELIGKAAGKIPLLGICLGHQAIGQKFGGKVIRAPQVMHGKTSQIYHNNNGVFNGLPCPFSATRYHSLIVERSNLPETLEIVAETADGTIMGIKHKEFQIHGVQFHPESIASEHGKELLRNFLNFCR